VANGHSLILIRQMVGLVRRALAEVCTVPALLAASKLVAKIDSNNRTRLYRSRSTSGDALEVCDAKNGGP